MGRSILLTGRPGAGKTTVIRTVASRLGLRAGGFYTEEIRAEGRRTGFRLVSLGPGPAQTGILASVNGREPYCVGNYRVNLPDLERVGVEAVRKAVLAPVVGVVVIDEIGRMELFSRAFRQVVFAALDSPKPVLATVMSASQPWVDAVKGRPDATVVEVTAENREKMPDRILGMLKAEGITASLDF